MTMLLSLCARGILLGALETFIYLLGFPGGSDGKNLPAVQEIWVDISATTMGNYSIGFMF